MNTEGVAQQVYKLANPTGQAIPDWMIIKNLALSMGKDVGVRNLAAIQEEIKSMLSAQEDTAEKKAFHPVEYRPGKEADNEYPFKLVIRDILQHSGSMSTSSKSLDLVVSEALLEINEDDAEKNNIADNSHVKVTSKQGSVFLKASVSEEVPEGTVFVPTHFPHAKINMLTRLSSNGENPINLVKIEKA
jgi:predicted molibdopterin-dependent oxidoreductase YjgC